MDQVFNTLELLELILLQLPTRDLLFAQRVSRKVRKLIQTSPTLQQALFFQPLPADQTIPSLSPSTHLFSHPSREPTVESWYRNPLLAEHFSPWFAPDHDILLKRRKFMIGLSCTAFDHLPGLTEGVRRDAMLRPEASWRRMLVVQPPVKQLELLNLTFGGNGPPLREATIQQPRGLTMGLLFYLTWRQMISRPSMGVLRSCRIQWHGAERRVVFVLSSRAYAWFGRCKGRNTLHFEAAESWEFLFTGDEEEDVEWKALRRLGDDSYPSNLEDLAFAGDYENDAS